MKSLEQKRKEAEVRRLEYAKLSVEEKIKMVESARGESKRQLLKLRKQLSK